MNNPYIHDPKTPTKFYPPRAIPENDMKHEDMQPAPRHDELRKQYEAEAAQNPKAYELHWQYRNAIDGVWCSCDSRPMWYENVDYRRKPHGHPHAELMAQYAEDAKTTDKPWGLWEAKAKGAEIWYPLQVPARWCEDQDYRRKPVAQDFLVFCEISVRALSAAEAAWTFRERVASGVAQVGVQERYIETHRTLRAR